MFSLCLVLNEDYHLKMLLSLKWPLGQKTEGGFLAPHGHFQAHPSQFSFPCSSSLETQAISIPCCVWHPPTAHHCFIYRSSHVSSLSLPLLPSHHHCWWLQHPDRYPCLLAVLQFLYLLMCKILFLHYTPKPPTCFGRTSVFAFLSIRNSKLNDLKLSSVFICLLTVCPC